MTSTATTAVRLASVRALLCALASLCAMQWAMAQTRAPAALSPVDTASLSVVEWLQRMHAGARQHNYIGTFVVSAAGGNLSSARIWHGREGDQQIERVEALSGPPRSTFRHNEQVLTFLPESRLIRSEKRETLEMFPTLASEPRSAIAEFYSARALGAGRVAGFEADIVQLAPRDALRFGYRLWSERRTGLLVKLQTLDGEGRVLEQSAFSELQLDVPIKSAALLKMMKSTDGFSIQTPELEHTTPQAEGWALPRPVAGFRPTSCLRRTLGQSATPQRMMQWTFSDGLATVSLFLEPYVAQRQPQEAVMALGATYTLTRRLVDARGDWWLTAVGEVPLHTLEAFAQGLERAP